MLNKYPNKNALFVLLLSVPLSCFAGINFASKEAGINLVGGKFSVSTSSISSWDGTLSTSSERNLTQGAIDFSGGRLVVNNVPAIISGRLQAAVSQQLRLLGSQTMRFDAGPLPARLYVSGIDNRFEGQPIFTINDTPAAPNITLAPDAKLTLAIQSTCNGFISLNDSTIILDDHLRLGDNKEFLGEGAVIANNKTIAFGGSDMVLTGTPRFIGPTEIMLHANTRLAGQWILGTTDATKEVNITGNGNVLDLSLGGTLVIPPGVKVVLSNIKVKGIGPGGFAFGDRNSQLKLSDAQLELDRTYTITSGNVYVNGDATIVTKDKFLRFSKRATLTVDGVSLWYDTGSYERQDNIQPVSTAVGAAANVYLKNGAAIKPIATTTSGDLKVDSSGIAFKDDKSFTLASRLVLTNYVTTIDGGSRALNFTGDDSLIVLPKGGRLTIKNTTLQNFSPQHVPLDPDQSIRFGGNTVIQLAPTKVDRAAGAIVLKHRWFFDDDSNILIDGGGNTLDISSNINALALVSRGTLTLQNMKIYGVGGVAGYSNFRSLNRHGTINLKNIELILTGDYTFYRGFLNIYPDVLLRGVGKKFTYMSECPLSIQDNAVFTLDYGMTFSYDTRDRGGKKAEHFKFASDAATLYLNGSRMHAASMGLRLSKGTIFADNVVTLSSEGTSAENAFVVASRVNMHVLSAATLKLDGKVVLE